jgi:tungstate transport system substrate-binding protein
MTAIALRRAALCTLLLFAVLTTCASALAQRDKELRLATTTSTENSGLLGVLLPVFEQHTGWRVRVVAVGTGAALKIGANGDADLVLVHARPAEDKFVAAGFGVHRRDVMFNDFVIVGPKADPAGLRGTTSGAAALRQIAERKQRFVSRGDDSGTHQMELALWADAGGLPKWPGYLPAGRGMGEVLMMASELSAYTLTDRGTYAAMRARLELVVLVEGDRALANPYGIIAVNPERHPHVNFKGALALIDWMTSPDGQKRIAAYRVNGAQLFFPSVAAR